jgi:hypothetical protein
VSLKDLLKSKATPESWTLGHGAPGDPKTMEAGEPPVVRSGTFVTYEQSDVNTRAVIRLGSIVLAITLAAVAATLGVFHLLARYEARSDPPRPPMAHEDPGRRPPEPQLQTAPAADYEQQRDRELAALNGYGVDRDRGAVHIPIDEAIRRYVQQAQARTVPSPSPAAGASPQSPAVPSPAPAGRPPGAGH